MPNDKPLPEKDDIIDLTDLVEEGSADSAATEAEKEVSADMSFEQELDDLFGDVAPEAPAEAPKDAAPDGAGDEDVIDLEGLELPETETTPPAAEADAGDEDIVDLTGLDLNALETTPDETAPEAAPDEAAAAAAPETAMTDLDLEAALGETAPAPEAPAAEEKEPAPVAAAPEAEAAAPAPEPPVRAVAPDEAMDVTELPGLAPLEEPAPTAAAAPNAAAEAIDLDALDQLILTAKGPVPEAEETPSEDALAAWNARLDALEAATTALTAQIQDIDLPDTEALAARLEAALTARFDALRTELTAEEAPAGPDLDAMRTELMAAIAAGRPDRESLIEDLRAALAPDFDAVRQSLPDTENFIHSKGPENRPGRSAGGPVRGPGRGAGDGQERRPGGHSAPGRHPRRPAGRPGGGRRGGSGLAERLTVLETDHSATDALAERLTALEADHLGADALTERVRHALLPEIPDVQTAITGVREGLAVDLAAVLQTAKQAARDEAKAMGDALSDRLTTLETDRIDPDALAERVKQALLPSAEELAAARETAQKALDGLDERLRAADLQEAMASFRTEIEADIARRVPQAAAAILRREIAALIKGVQLNFFGEAAAWRHGDKTSHRCFSHPRPGNGEYCLPFRAV